MGNQIARDTSRSNSPLGTDGFRVFTRDMRNTSVYLSPLHPDYYEGYEIPNIQGAWCPSGNIYCFGYFGMARRGVGTSGNSVPLSQINTDVWSTIYQSNNPWSVALDPILDIPNNPTADPDVYYPNIQHYYDNLVGMNVMFRNKNRTGPTWSLARNEARQDAIYPTWAFSPGGDATWTYPEVYESIIDPSNFTNLDGEPAATNTTDFGGQIYTQYFFLDPVQHKMFAYIGYNKYTHDASVSGHADYHSGIESHTISFREDAFMSYTDNTTGGQSTWTTQPVTIPDNGENEYGLHISADVFDGGSLTVEAFTAGDNDTLNPVTALSPLSIDAGSYYIGDIINLWEDSSNVLDGLAGQDIVFTFTLDDAKMYAFAFGEAGEVTTPEPEPACYPEFKIDIEKYRGHTRASNGGFGVELPPLLSEFITYENTRLSLDDTVPFNLNSNEGTSIVGDEVLALDYSGGQFFIESLPIPGESLDHEFIATITLQDAIFNPETLSETSIEDHFSPYNQYAFYNDYVEVSDDGSSLSFAFHWKSGVDSFMIDILEGAESDGVCVTPEIETPEPDPVHDIALSQEVLPATYGIFNEAAQYTLIILNEGDHNISEFSVAFSGYGNQMNGVGHTSSFGDGICSERNNTVTCDFLGTLSPEEREDIIFYFDTSSLNTGESVTTYAEIIDFAPGQDIDSIPGNNSSNEDDDTEVTFVK